MDCPSCTSSKPMHRVVQNYLVTSEIPNLHNVIVKNCEGYSCTECNRFVPSAHDSKETKKSFYNLVAMNILCQPFPLTGWERQALCQIANLKPVDIGHLMATESCDGSPNAVLGEMRIGQYIISTENGLTFAMEGLFRFKILQKMMADQADEDLYFSLYQEITEALDMTILSPQEKNFEIRIDLQDLDNLEFIIKEEESV